MENNDKINDNELILKTNFTVTSADTDMFSRIRPGALLNFLIQSAIQSADDLGFGFEGLWKHRMFWVLSRLTMEIYRPIKWGEKLEVLTWPKDIYKLFYLRDFIVEDKKGNVAVKSTSAWLAVDLDSKRPKHIDGIEADYFTQLNNKHALQEFPEKLEPVEGTDMFTIETTYFDIDLNKHVTSTRYVDWMMDTFSPYFHANKYPEKLSVNYIKETGPQEQILLKRSKDGQCSYNFEGLNQEADTEAFRGKIDFR
ncbi:MAG: thioesterase [Bacteroidales bacterium]